MKLKFKSVFLFLNLVIFTSCLNENHNPDHPHNTSFYIDYRSLKGSSDGIAVIELDPEAPNFGNISSRLELGIGVLPHHIYYNLDAKKMFTTALGGSYLYEIKTGKDQNGQPKLISATPIDTGENTVGENLFFTNDGRYFMTFMGVQEVRKMEASGFLMLTIISLSRRLKHPFRVIPINLSCIRMVFRLMKKKD
ncbi:hypothetical protein OWR28_26010 [Chryseobacterium sp. 1B4]